MRYDTPVYFQKIKAGAYDPETGDYADNSVVETKRWANVTDSRTDAITVQYGDLKQGNLIVRLQRRYTEPFDRVRIGSRTYKEASGRAFREKGTFVLTEVQ